MKKLVLIGIMQHFKLIEPLFNPMKTEIIAYYIWNPEDVVVFNGTRVYSYEDIAALSFDYAVLVSESVDHTHNQLLASGVPAEKILIGLNYYKSFYFINRILSDESYELFITGMSYAYGLLESELKKNALNLAFPGQDLLMDYWIARFMLESRMERKPKFALIGLAYNSFDYEFMQTRPVEDPRTTKRRVLNWPGLVARYLFASRRFAPALEKSLADHRVQQIASFTQECAFLVSPFERLLWGHDRNMDLLKNPPVGTRSIPSPKIIETSLKVSNKHYPDSVEANTSVLRSYLELLTKHGVKPVIVVHPQHPDYVEHFSENMIARFQEKVLLLREDFHFQFIDCFDSGFAQADDFKDVDHLTREASARFTRYLNDVVEWN